MKKIVCRLDFHKFGNTDLDTFVIEVRNGIYTNPGTFSAPPFSEGDYETIQEKYNNAAADYAQYGLTKKVAFQDAKDTLMKTLDELAAYVDSVANGNVSTIALSGFEPTSDVVHPTAPLDKIDSFEVRLTKTSGQISVEIPAYAKQTGVNYFCVCVAENPLTNPTITNGQLRTTAEDKNVVVDCNRSRRKTIGGLTPGVKYFFYVFASNTAGVSPLSNPQSIYVS